MQISRTKNNKKQLTIQAKPKINILGGGKNTKKHI